MRDLNQRALQRPLGAEASSTSSWYDPGLGLIQVEWVQYLWPRRVLGVQEWREVHTLGLWGFDTVDLALE